MKAEVMIASQTERSVWYSTGVKVLLGTLYIALLSQIAIPLKPVPVTLQTFAIFSLALFQGGKHACYSLLLYLVAGTMGFPVFPFAQSNPLWFLHFKAGYYFSFPLAAYLVGQFAMKGESPSVIRMLVVSCGAMSVIYLMGVAWLSFGIGWEQALMVGLYPFIVFDLIKIFAAVTLKMAAKPFIAYLN